LTKHLVSVYSAGPGLHTLAPKQDVVSQDICQWQFLPDTPSRKKQQNLPGSPAEVSAQAHHKRELQFPDPPHLPTPGTMEGRLKAASRFRNIFNFPVTCPLKSARLQKRSLADGLRVPTVQHASSTASHTLHGPIPLTVKRFCTVPKRCCASFP